MEFAATLRHARRSAGLSQTELSQRTGYRRPNISAYEAGRREPLWSTAIELLEGTGSTLHIDEPVRWSWTDTPRPYAVPDRLWRLPLNAAFAPVTPDITTWWSGPPRTFELRDPHDRRRYYEIALREATPDIIQSTVDGALLTDSWNDLVLPQPLRLAWVPLINGRSTMASVA